MKHVIVFCNTQDELNRLMNFINENKDDYKFIRMYTRSCMTRLRDDAGRVFSCRTEKAQFMLRLMFETKNYVV